MSLFGKWSDRSRMLFFRELDSIDEASCLPAASSARTPEVRSRLWEHDQKQQTNLVTNSDTVQNGSPQAQKSKNHNFRPIPAKVGRFIKLQFWPIPPKFGQKVRSQLRNRTLCLLLNDVIHAFENYMKSLIMITYDTQSQQFGYLQILMSTL